MKLNFKLLLMIGLVSLVLACRKTKSPAPGPGEVRTPWQFFTVANSRLPNQQVNAVAISKNDVKWIGTANGLVRIAGDTWTVYNQLNSGLPSPVIQALTVQENGMVWVGTNKGLARFDGTAWSVYTPANSVLPDEAIMSLTHDNLHQLTWIGTAKGIAEVSGTGQWKLHDETGGVLPLSMTTDQNGALWVGAHDPFNFRGSIQKFRNGTWTTYQLDNMGYASAFPYAIGIDKDNAVVAVLAGTVVRAAIKLTVNGWKELTLPKNAQGMRAMAMEQDKIWTGGAEFMRLTEPSPAVIDIPTKINTILCLAVDSHGYKWLGTIDSGLVVYHE